MFPHAKLTHIEINKAKPKAKPYKLWAGDGLFLLVRPNGSKYWRLKYRFEGKEKSLSIGTYPVVSLAEADKAVRQAKTTLRAGKDPSQAKRDAAKLKNKPTAYKSNFRMEVTKIGGLVIETSTKLIELNAAQAAALKAFLLASDAEAGDADE